jgi:hypothetical protein
LQHVKQERPLNRVKRLRDVKFQQDFWRSGLAQQHRSTLDVFEVVMN